MDKDAGYYRQQLSKAIQNAVCGGLFNGSFGFLSTRVHHTQNILIAPGTLSSSDLKPEDYILIDLNANITDASDFETRPFLEFIIDAYRIRPEINAIGHFHPLAATAVSRMDRDFPVVGSHNGRKVGEVLRVGCRTCPSRFAGLCSCFENQRSSYAGVNALLIKDDGIVTLDQHLYGAIDRAENMERIAARFVDHSAR